MKVWLLKDYTCEGVRTLELRSHAIGWQWRLHLTGEPATRRYGWEGITVADPKLGHELELSGHVKVYHEFRHIGGGGLAKYFGWQPEVKYNGITEVLLERGGSPVKGDTAVLPLPPIPPVEKSCDF